MRIRQNRGASLRLVLVLATAILTAAAQRNDASGQRETVKAELARLLHYPETEPAQAVEDLAAVRSVAGKRGETAVQNTPPKPCSQPVYRQFDFWVGEWNVYSEGKLAGTNSVQKILGGCVILENWTDALGNSGKSFNTYNPHKKKWQQNWVDDRGSVLEFTGEAQNGVMSYQAQLPASGGGKVSYRMTFTKRSENRVRQLWKQSIDGGKTWQTLFDGDYQRKP